MFRRWFMILAAGVGMMLLLPLVAAGAQGEPRTLPPPGTTAAQGALPSRPLFLDPFYLIREENSRCWVERVVVEVEVTRAEPHPSLDFSAPEYRKLLYEYLKSQEQGSELEGKILNALNQQAKSDRVRAVRISRSIVIVR